MCPAKSAVGLRKFTEPTKTTRRVLGFANVVIADIQLIYGHISAKPGNNGDLITRRFRRLKKRDLHVRFMEV